MEYDATYKLNGGKTVCHVVSPERVLGRKMTEEEIQAILDEVKRIKIDRLIRLQLEANGSD